MLKAIKQYFEELVRVSDQETSAEEKLRIATAALLIEMMRADNHHDEREEQAILRLLHVELEVPEQELKALFQLAKLEADEAVDFYQFTRLINEHYQMPEKIKLIKNLWRVAYADGHISAFEEHYLRKIAELLHIPHSQYIHAKLAIAREAGQ